MELYFTTQYGGIYRQMKDRERLRDFLIVLPLKRIVSINLYAIEVNQNKFKFSLRRTAGAPSTSQEASNPGLLATLLWLLIAWIARR